MSQEWNSYAANCPTRVVLDRIADKWTVLVIGLLVSGPARFNQMRREIEGVSQKMLAQTLKKLERDGLLERMVFATVPVIVQYSITPLGRTLAEAIGPLQSWAETHIEEVIAAQERYDRAKSGALSDRGPLALAAARRAEGGAPRRP